MRISYSSGSCTSARNKDVNLLEPAYAVKFDSIQGLKCRVPSGKRDFLMPVDVNHCRHFQLQHCFLPLRCKPTPLKVFQKEVPMPPQQVKYSAPRLSGKPGNVTSCRIFIGKISWKVL
ncbi:hypothetical protein ACP70R_047118 [Stipagrostis hirtigluma subsp. patula]